MKKDTITAIIPKIINIICFLTIFFTIITKAWCSDDAYHAFIMAKNLNEGNGFTPTIGIRVNVSTCPLWTLVVALVDHIINNMYATGIILNIIFSSLAIALLMFYICKSNVYINIFISIILIFSNSFISFTTSGLENSLLFFLTILFCIIYHKQHFTRWDLFLIALLEGLIAFTRMDVALIFSFACIYAYLSHLKNIRNLLSRCIIAFLGLMPFLLWEVFSLIYYGSFFPNTMLAKLNTGYPTEQYIKRGLYYLQESFLWDPIVLFIPFICIILLVITLKNSNCRSEMIKLLTLGLGLLLYFCYILYIGGDFMLGRHFTVIFFISLALCSYLYTKQKSIYILFSIGIILTPCVLYLNQTINIPCPYVYVDERNEYDDYTGLLVVLKDYFEDKSIDVIETCPHRGIQWYYGNESFIYKTGDTEILVQSYEERLYDPLLVRLPAIPSDSWVVGHMEREMPEGYKETLATGVNYIENKNLKEYYDKLRIVLSENVFAPNRLETLVNMLKGKYEYLIADYRTNELGY